jgi:hypothetical protein
VTGADPAGAQPDPAGAQAGLAGAQPDPAGAQPDPAGVAARSAPDWLDPSLRAVGGVVAVALALATALWQALLVPLYLTGTTRLPVSVVAALLGNAALVWFTWRVTGRLAVAALPAVLWLAVMLAAATRTSEGDLVFAANNWVGMATLLAGSAGLAGAFMVLMPRAVGARGVARDAARR